MDEVESRAAVCDTRDRQVLTRTVMSRSPNLGHHIWKLRVTIRSLFKFPPWGLLWMKGFLSTPCPSPLSCPSSKSYSSYVLFIAQWALLINYWSGVRGLLHFSQIELDEAQRKRRSYYSLDLVPFFSCGKAVIDQCLGLRYPIGLCVAVKLFLWSLWICVYKARLHVWTKKAEQKADGGFRVKSEFSLRSL